MEEGDDGKDESDRRSDSSGEVRKSGSEDVLRSMLALHRSRHCSEWMRM